jgi:hypothetical protein
LRDRVDYHRSLDGITARPVKDTNEIIFRSDGEQRLCCFNPLTGFYSDNRTRFFPVSPALSALYRFYEILS